MGLTGLAKDTAKVRFVEDMRRRLSQAREQKTPLKTEVPIDKM
jgi:hypothetical protein